MNRFRRGREKLLLYTHFNAQDFPFIPSRNGGEKMCYNRQDTGESDFCFVSGTKKETFFDTREEEKCGNTTKTQMSWKRRCVTAAEKSMKIQNGMLLEGICSVDTTWGTFPGRTWKRHEFDLCEECYDRITASFAVPPKISEDMEG